jgi:hypothetical protein
MRDFTRKKRAGRQPPISGGTANRYRDEPLNSSIDLGGYWVFHSLSSRSAGEVGMAFKVMTWNVENVFRPGAPCGPKTQAMSGWKVEWA